MKKIYFALFAVLFISKVFAQEEVNFRTDRPGFCYSPVTVPKGKLILETGLGLDLLYGIQNWGLAIHDFRYGVVKNFELKTGIRVNGLNNTNNLMETSLSGALMAGFKWGIVNKGVQLGYVAEVYIPTNPAIVTAQHSLNLSHAVGKVTSINYLIQHNYDFSQLRMGNSSYFGGLQLSFLISFAILERWSFYMEGTAQWDSGNSTYVGAIYDAGLVYMIKDNLQIDFFFGQGINFSYGTYGIGLSWMPLPKKKIIEE